jgi:hypothetical protein
MSEYLSTSGRVTRASKRPDYRQLNDGSDNEADIVDRMEQSTIATNLPSPLNRSTK